MTDCSNVNIEVATGFTDKQFNKLMEAIKKMESNLTEKVTALETELADVRATVDMIVPSFEALQGNLTAAQTAFAVLQTEHAETLAQNEAMAAVITDASDRIDAATVNANAIDEALEDVSGENTPTDVTTAPPEPVP